MSRIEQIISEIEEYIEGCKSVPLSSTKIAVNKDELESLLRELRLKVPDEIKKYQRMLSNKEAIMADAKEKAQEIINEAQIQRDELINEHEIMQNAYAQANDIVEEATKHAKAIVDRANLDAINIREGALGYADDMLANVQSILEKAFDINKVNYENLLDSISNDIETVVANRNELAHTENEGIPADDTEPVTSENEIPEE